MILRNVLSQFFIVKCFSKSLLVLFGVPLKNDLLAITSAKIMEVNNNFPHINKSSSLTFLKYKYCVNKSRDKSRGHFAKHLK